MTLLTAVLTLQEHGAEAAHAPAAHGAGFEPFLPGLILLLPLIGFAINGVLAAISAVRGANALRIPAAHGAHGDPSAGHGGHGADHGAHGADAHGAHDDHEHDPSAPKPWTHTLPSFVAPGVMGLAFLVAVVNFLRMSAAEPHDPTIVRWWTWIRAGNFEVDAAIQLDPLSMIMVLVITGVGFLIHLFSVGYMKEDPAYPRYFAWLNLFVFFMLVLVLGSSFPLMFVGWEGVGLCSYLLIGYWFQDKEKSDAGKKAFIVNRIGDVGFMLATFLLFRAFGTLDFTGIFPHATHLLPYGGGLVAAITLFFLVGAAGKSAQVPLYVWLPDAMAGPTPVSALIHAATMVTAGVYLVARSSILFALSPVGSAAVAGIGVLTALFAATIALAQNDIKKVLAYSTVSQLGYMFLGVGVGAYAAGVFHLMTHAFFKALLFLGSGAVIHAMHHAYHATHSQDDPQDMRNMGGLRRFLPVTWITMWIGTLAIAGVWPFAGFFSKDEIIWYAGAWAGAERAPFPGLYTVYWVLALTAAMLTAFYMTRLMILTFHGSNRTGEKERTHLHENPLVMTVPLMVLAVLSVFGGWINVPEAIRESFLGGFGALPMSEWLHHWLHPVIGGAEDLMKSQLGEPSHHAPIGGGELAWALASTVLALGIVLVTSRVLSRRTVLPAAADAEPTGLRRILANKWYVDELYEAGVVRPIQSTARVFWRIIDAGIIDGTVNTIGNLARAVGWFGSLFHSGRINTYAFVLTLGVLLVLGAVVL